MTLTPSHQHTTPKQHMQACRDLITQGRLVEARDVLATIQPAPNNGITFSQEETATFLDLCLELGALLLDRQHPAVAMEPLQWALQLSPGHAVIYGLIAQCHRSLGQAKLAVEQAMLALAAKHPLPQEMHYLLGRAYGELGEWEPATAQFLTAIELEPGFGLAWHGLSQTRRFSSTDLSLLQQAESCLAQCPTPADRSLLHFALGKMHDDLKQWSQAFHHYQEGNTLRKPAVAPRQDSVRFHAYQQTYPRTLSRTLNPGKHPRPVFIVGMPRSGSTLLEQILAAHPEVGAAGELAGIQLISNAICPPGRHGQMAEYFAAALDSGKIGELIDGYLGYMASQCPGKAVAIDKAPSNYLRLGLIYTLFPDAVVLHTLRHPLDTALSCYFQPFENIAWASELQWIAQEYCFYRKVMAHWKTVLPSAWILDVHYEALVEKPEPMVRSILEHCGLPWHDNCLSFHTQSNTVRTASVYQVRQPLYQTSQHRWLSYIEHVRAIAEPLKPYLTTEEYHQLASPMAPLATPSGKSIFSRLSQLFQKSNNPE